MQTRYITLNIGKTMEDLLSDEDIDKDKKITIDDRRIQGTFRGDKNYEINCTDGRKFTVSGTYYLSNLLQELELARKDGSDTATIDLSRVYELPVQRTSRLIREYYWEGLTRRIDEQHLPQIIRDTKIETQEGLSYLYCPAADQLAVKYYSDIALRHPEWKLVVRQIPGSIDNEYVKMIKEQHGLLSLALRRVSADSIEALPFVVPGGRFNEMYGWDSYFEALGLIEDGRIDLACAMIDHFVYEIKYYGKILNANRTYYLTRSQPPFLTSMLRAVKPHLPENNDTGAWLKIVLEAAIKEYRRVWMGKDRLTRTGLSRYWDSGEGVPPEVEPGHFGMVFAGFARKYNMDPKNFERDYRSGILSVPELDLYFKHDRAMRESGHDTSYRLEGIAADLVTVDLNSLLYKIESDIAELLLSEYKGSAYLNGKLERSEEWKKYADYRRRRMTELMWNDEEGLFYDYNVRLKKQHAYVSATTLYPLWAGLATKDQAERMIRKALPQLEMEGGLAASSEASRGPLSEERPERQWDYPFGWAPHQILAWEGLRRYGYYADAERLAFEWLLMITRNAASYNGTIPEKFDVVRCTHAVFAEYGNVGTKFFYMTREGFGWMNASYQIGLRFLEEEDKDRLNRLSGRQDN